MLRYNGKDTGYEHDEKSENHREPLTKQEKKLFDKTIQFCYKIGKQVRGIRRKQTATKNHVRACPKNREWGR